MKGENEVFGAGYEPLKDVRQVHLHNMAVLFWRGRGQPNGLHSVGLLAKVHTFEQPGSGSKLVCVPANVKFVLAPLYLGTFYAALVECVHNITRLVVCYDMVTHFNSSFLQMFWGGSFH